MIQPTQLRAHSLTQRHNAHIHSAIRIRLTKHAQVIFTVALSKHQVPHAGLTSAAVAAAAAAADDRVTRLWTEEGAPSPSPIEEDREVSCCVAIVLRVSLGPPIPPSLPRATKRVCPSVPRQEHGAMETAREDKQRGAGKVGTSARGSTLRAARLIQVGGAR